ncbi:glycosyl hydrolase family 95 catalytic domain-containing protein [Pedobacter sp. JCM 36344]|uniref:glycoside hydrolase family 95 protein n=1 Tax=Pedobacter sp. JCM 36344 TaxID=3374280 RepID=UPI00397D268A
MKNLFWITCFLLHCFSGSATVYSDSSSRSRKLQLWYTSPGKDWASEALPIGNGYMGGMIFGGIEKEQIQYNEKTLWSGGPGAWKGYQGGNRDSAARYLPEIREKILKQDYKGAESLMGQHMLGNPRAFGAYQSFGNIHLDFSGQVEEKNVRDYLRALDLQEGLVRVEFNHNNIHYKREYFCSYPDRVMVIRLSADKPESLTFNVTADCNQSKSRISSDLTTKSISTTGRVTDNKLGLESIIKVFNDGGEIMWKENGFRVNKANSVIILMTAATEYVNSYPRYTGANPRDTVMRIMGNAAKKDFQVLLKNHQQDYQKLFNRVKLDLDAQGENVPTDELVKTYSIKKTRALEELMFQYGRYLLISSSREGSLPANLQGVWNNSNNPPWNGDYHFDINIEMNYFGAEVTNLTECSVPLVDYINSLRAPGRVTAEKHHGVTGGGWVVHPMNNPFGFTAPGWETYWGWAPFNAGWICQNLWDKYRFNGDKTYLRKHIYPTLKEQAQFWQKWLIPDENGFLVSSPSVSPEHLPITDGPTSDESMCYELFSDVIEASKVLRIDARFRRELLKMREKLLPLKVGSWGQLQEWKYDWDKKDDNHRHVSHLISVYQGERINPFTSPNLANAAKVSLQARDNVKGDVQGWSLTQRIGLWARLQEPEKAMGHLSALLSGYINKNLFSLTGNVFQIDANLGVPGMIAEMLLQSHLGAIHVLPALPQAWEDGKVQGLRARGGFVVDIEWHKNQVSEVRINSEVTEKCTLITASTGNGFSVVEVESGKTIKNIVSGNSLTFRAKAGKQYRVVKI